MCKNSHSLAFIEAEETSRLQPAALVVIRHPHNGDIALRSGSVLPDSPYDRMNADAPALFTVTPKGMAAAHYLKARSEMWETILDTAKGTADGCPDYNRPQVEAAQILRDTAAAIYVVEYDGCICEDCGQLESCCCPDC